MHARNDNTKPVGTRRGERRFELAMPLPGLLVACDAWREITHHGGILLLDVPAAAMSILAARRARPAKRGTRR